MKVFIYIYHLPPTI